MKYLFWTSSFTKDVKRLTKRGWKMQKLFSTLEMLRQEVPLPEIARSHMLHGKWAGSWECHIGGDWLLIYDRADHAILLRHTGSHADLFE